MCAEDGAAFMPRGMATGTSPVAQDPRVGQTEVKVSFPRSAISCQSRQARWESVTRSRFLNLSHNLFLPAGPDAHKQNFGRRET